MREIRRLSWQIIDADNEYAKFVGASITPKTVSGRIYDALVFGQSNTFNGWRQLVELQRLFFGAFQSLRLSKTNLYKGGMKENGKLVGIWL